MHSLALSNSHLQVSGALHAMSYVGIDVIITALPVPERAERRQLSINMIFFIGMYYLIWPVR